MVDTTHSELVTKLQRIAHADLQQDIRNLSADSSDAHRAWIEERTDLVGLLCDAIVDTHVAFMTAKLPKEN